MAQPKVLHHNHSSRNSHSNTTHVPLVIRCLGDTNLDQGLFLALGLLSRPSKVTHMDTCPLRLVFLTSTGKHFQVSCSRTNKMASSPDLRYPKATSPHRAI